MATMAVVHRPRSRQAAAAASATAMAPKRCAAHAAGSQAWPRSASMTCVRHAVVRRAAIDRPAIRAGRDIAVDALKRPVARSELRSAFGRNQLQAPTLATIGCYAPRDWTRSVGIDGLASPTVSARAIRADRLAPRRSRDDCRPIASVGRLVVDAASSHRRQRLSRLASAQSDRIGRPLVCSDDLRERCTCTPAVQRDVSATAALSTAADPRAAI